MAMRLPGRGSSLVAEINVTPMADVIIVLLIIFMVATPLLSGAHVPLPYARHGSGRPPAELRIRLAGGGSLSLDERPLAGVDFLRHELEARHRNEGEGLSVRIEADAGVDYASVARVFDACRSAGLHEIALATRPRID